MVDGYTVFLNKFGKMYPETYIKIIECPDEIITGWINGIKDDRKMISLENHEKVNTYFELMLTLLKGSTSMRI